MNRHLIPEFYKFIAQTSDDPSAVEIERAEGMHLYAKSGKEYLDLIAGISVCNMGHSNPRIINAVKNQLDKYMHVMVYGEVVQDTQVELAELLCGCLPDNLQSVFFVNSGSEAVEGGLKLAKRVTGRLEMIHCDHSYHGATHGAMSVMGCDEYHAAFKPLLPNTKAIRFGVEEDLMQITEKTACFIVEPVQGEGGVRFADKSYWQKVRKRCDQTGTLLIFDEVQTGLGRTGTLFAFQQYGIVPDIMLLAKALGGGLPLGAFISSRENMQLLTHNPALGHICTFGGHPVSCAAALEHLKLILETKIFEHADAKGKQLEQILFTLKGVKQIRRQGLLMAVDFENQDYNLAMVKKFFDVGLFTDWFLFCPTALRIAPPLIIDDNEMEELKTKLALIS